MGYIAGSSTAYPQGESNWGIIMGPLSANGGAPRGIYSAEMEAGASAFKYGGVWQTWCIKNRLVGKGGSCGTAVGTCKLEFSTKFINATVTLNSGVAVGGAQMLVTCTSVGFLRRQAVADHLPYAYSPFFSTANFHPGPRSMERDHRQDLSSALGCQDVGSASQVQHEPVLRHLPLVGGLLDSFGLFQVSFSFAFVARSFLYMIADGFSCSRC